MASHVRTGSDDAITGINVTPLVDITFVLLIIFMVTAKVSASQSVPLDLPRPGPTATMLVMQVTVLGDGEVVVDGKKVRDDAIVPLMRDAVQRHPDVRAVLKADSRVSHGRFVQVLDLLKQGGISKIGFPATSTPPLPK